MFWWMGTEFRLCPSVCPLCGGTQKLLLHWASKIVEGILVFCVDDLIGQQQRTSQYQMKKFKDAFQVSVLSELPPGPRGQRSDVGVPVSVSPGGNFWGERQPGVTNGRKRRRRGRRRSFNPGGRAGNYPQCTATHLRNVRRTLRYFRETLLVCGVI